MSDDHKLDYILERLDAIEANMKPIQEHVANVEGAFKFMKGLSMIAGIVIAFLKLRFR